MTSSWPDVRLGDVLLEAKPGFASGHDLDEGVFQFRMNNLTSDGHLDLSKRRRVPRDSKKIDSFLLEPGDILFNATNSPELVGKSGYIAQLDEPAVFSNHFLRLRANTQRVEPRFVWRWLQLQWHRGLFRSRARQWVNQATYGREALVELRLPLPPLQEQRRVTGVLERADELRRRREVAIGCLSELERAVFDAFLQGTRDSPLVPLAEAVERVTVGHVGPTSEHFTDRGIPFLRTGNVGDGEIIRTSLRFITPEFHARLKKSTLRAGDVVISRVISDEIRAAVIPRELDGANCANVIVVRPGAKVTPNYLQMLVRLPASQAALLGRRVGSAQGVVNTRVLQQWAIPVPTRDRLELLDRRIDRVHLISDRMRTSATQLEALQQALQHLAFAGSL